MGGCRCIFRECTVATSRHPRMHFFRFPIKDRARLLKWIAMAKVPSLLNLPMSVQKNKCVCARHFRDECFMNYMKDKLVTSAVPTLERIKGGYAIDYEDGVVKIVKLHDPVLPHMIPPPDFECPLHLEELENDMEDFLRYTKSSISSSVSKRKLATADSTIVSKKSKVLNTQAPERVHELTEASTTDGFISKFVQFVDVSEEQNQEKYLLSMDDCILLEDGSNKEITEMQIIETAPIEMVEAEENTIETVETVENTIETVEPEENTSETVEQEGSTTKNIPYKVYEVSKINDSNKAKRQNDKIRHDYELQLQKERTKYVTYEENSSKQEMQLVEALQTASRDLEIKTLQYDTDTQELTSKIKQLTANNSDLESKCENLTISNCLLINRLKMFEEKYNSLQEQYNDLRANNLALQQMQQQQQVSTVSTSKEAPSNKATASGMPAPTLAQCAVSKAQLFNGIKKYLCSSMVALVRMEMFGSAERQWKPDEKQASLDLLTLGENVYKYFTDEWRFRLPGLRELLAWQHEAAAAPDDEEDL